MASLRRVMTPSVRALSTSAAVFNGLVKKRGVGQSFYIVDTTLREGEQHATTEFSRQDRIYIAKLLDKMGVDYIELVNPFASTQVRSAVGRSVGGRSIRKKGRERGGLL
jgi:hypothetical protein